MKTSIQINKETLEKLKRLKEAKNLSTYEEVINSLINEANDLPETMFGIDKGKLTKYQEEDRLEFRET